MLKFLSFLSFTFIYLSASAQKASYYIDKTVDLNKFNYFYMSNSPLDAHDLTSPYLIKNDLKDNENNYFILYNELSLKNLNVVDGHMDSGAFGVTIYEGTSFDPNTQIPAGYKPKKLKKNTLVIDFVDGASKLLVWRGWIDLSKIKSSTPYQRYQRAICCILTNFQIQPVITD